MSARKNIVEEEYKDQGYEEKGWPLRIAFWLTFIKETLKQLAEKFEDE
jgi:hypothetical protein